MIRGLWLLLALLVLALGTGGVRAQTYPDKPVRVIVGYPPGGGTDVVARIITPKLSELLGQPVVIENRPGATGITAAAYVAKSAPDGYTLMMGHVSIHAISPHVFAKLPYDAEKDFAPIILAASVPHIIVVPPSSPLKSIRDLIALAKAQPGKLTFPSAGNASTPHLAGEMFKSLAGVDLVHVPYKGSGQSMQDLLGGVHAVAFDTMPAIAPYVRSGRLRALAVTSAKRLPEFPDVPTVAESGLPAYHMTTWYGLFAPAGTPAAIISRLHAETARAMQAPDVRAHLVQAGVDDTATRTPEEFGAMVQADFARWAKIVKAAGVHLD
jgi:tripartite-type tricarboxylate transporter receptor subunit TctC